MAIFTFALPAGRLGLLSLDFFKKTGLCEINIPPESRELCFTDPTGQFRVVLVRPSDVPTYIMQGGAQAGITGKDILLERNHDLTTPLELDFGQCRLSLAAPSGFEMNGKKHLRVATKYPTLASDYLYHKGISCDIIKLHGSVEIAPALGLSDCIVDLVSTGATLKANGLLELDVILESMAVLAIGRHAYALHPDKCAEMLRLFRKSS